MKAVAETRGGAAHLHDKGASPGEAARALPQTRPRLQDPL